MKYIEYAIEIPEGVYRDVLIATLGDYGCESFEEEGNLLKAYMREVDYLAQHSSIEELLSEQKLYYITREMADENWNAVWESNFEAIEVEGRCRIRAPFHPKNPACEYDIEIMPKMSFGTGHHATTYLMAAEIMACDFSGQRGLDMGSGTGVLAILAVKRGASHMDAIDIDAWAYENGTENVHSNGLAEKITPLMGDVALLAGRKYDFVLANINRNILLADMGAYVATLSPGGCLIVSGILEADIPALVACGVACGVEECNIRRREGWAAIRFVKL